MNSLQNEWQTFKEGGKVEKMLMYNSQHIAKFEFCRPELKIRLLFWFKQTNL